MKAQLIFSASFPAPGRTAIEQAFTDEGIETEVSPNDMEYRGVAVSPENLIIGYIISVPLLQFLQGYFSAAGADAWAATKRAFKRVRATHDGGQDVTFTDEDGRITFGTSSRMIRTNETPPSMRSPTTSLHWITSMSDGGSVHPSHAGEPARSEHGRAIPSESTVFGPFWRDVVGNRAAVRVVEPR